MKDKSPAIPIIYEDNHIIVIEKPPGLLSQKDKTNEVDVTCLMKEYLKTKYNKPGNVYLGLVHRLDKPVGGLMVLTKTSKAASRLSFDIRNHLFKKNYLAIVEGNILLQVKKDKKAKLSYLDKDGKEAYLSYTPLKSNDLYTLVSVDLYTGRFHQIRLSFSTIGHPIVNDQKYHSQSKKGPLYLWAHQLSFLHPITKEMMTFTSMPSSWPLL